MIKLTLLREPSTELSTPGQLILGAKRMCYTLEDPVREGKIAGVTAIPEGTYQIIRSFSPRFKVQMALLLRVPNFSGVRIHAGNTAKDTEGCILLGAQRVNSDTIGSSRVAVAAFDAFLVNALRTDEVWIEIVNP